jgi:hypothetical protein
MRKRLHMLDFFHRLTVNHFNEFRFWHKSDVKIYSIGKLLNAASAAWKRQTRLHVSVESNGAESPA